MVEGLPVLNPVTIDCDTSALGKMQRDEFIVNANRRRRDILEMVQTYLCGNKQTRSLGGAYYFLLFIDDCIRFTWVYFLRKKSHTFEYFKEFRSMVEKQTDKCIRIIHSNKRKSTKNLP